MDARAAMPPRLPDRHVLVRRDSLDSTNDEAKRLAEHGAADRTVIWAREQTAGHGQRRRRWESPEGNLYASFIYRPDVAPAAAPQSGIAAALAVIDVLRAVLPTGRTITCKWPNDVLVNGAKISGVLAESTYGGEGRLDWIVIGCGVNCVSHPDSARWPATDLHAEGAAETAPALLLERLTFALDRWIACWAADGFEPLRQVWLASAHGLGEPVQVTVGGTMVVGTLTGMAADGGLVVTRGDGSVSVVRHGELYPKGG